MTTLDQVIDLQITISDKAPSQPNFGMPMLAGYHTRWVDRVREYSEADDMLDDGFTVDDQLYKMAVALKAQTPCPATFKVGRLANAYTHTVTLTVESAVEGFEYDGEINGEPIAYEVPAAATLTTVATAIELLVEAVTGIASSSAVAVITATSAAGVLGSYWFDRGVKIKDTTVDPGVTADLAAINDEDSEWYGLLLDCNSEAIVTAAAIWAEANKKLFVTQSSDWDIVDPGQTTDLASDLKALALTRTVGIYHRGIGRQVDLVAPALMAVGLTADPGSITWSFKPLATVSVDDRARRQELRFVRRDGRPQRHAAHAHAEWPLRRHHALRRLALFDDPDRRLHVARQQPEGAVHGRWPVGGQGQRRVLTRQGEEEPEPGSRP
jgi:hypothetical protein